MKVLEAGPRCRQNSAFGRQKAIYFSNETKQKVSAWIDSKHICDGRLKVIIESTWCKPDWTKKQRRGYNGTGEGR